MAFISRFLGAATILIFSLTPALGEVRLLMFEEEGCPWCELWREEIGVIYDKTDEGKAAPLVVLDILEAVPEQYSLNSGAFYTPTFVLVQNNVEVDRIEGYPGQDFFWGLLQGMLEKVEDEGNGS